MMKKHILLKIRRISALIGVIIILLLYAATLVLAFIDRSQSRPLLMASLFATFFIAFVLYAMSLMIRLIQRSDSKDDQ